MNKRTRLLCLACVSGIISVLVCFTSLHGLERILKDSSHRRADVLQIDGMKSFGRLEKAPVEFLHDKHTKALAEKNLDCTACHLTENGYLSIQFKRTADTGKTEVMNIYHKGCISCHGEMRLAGEKTGPVECDSCHKPEPEYASSREPMGFDQSLHFRHSEALEKKCEQCHHEYDEKTKKLFYAKGKEGTCRYCHQAETENNVISMRLASHSACVNCHNNTAGKNKATGPVTCSGCHDPAEQQKIKEISPIPRMEMKQPDVVLLKTGGKDVDPDGERENRMKLVPFDHLQHEKYNDTCRVCHHESLQPCNECHTLAGKKEGNGVNLQQAMHRADATESCIGCHEKQQKTADCAGCHAMMGESHPAEEASCAKCHMMPLTEPVKTLTPEYENALASEMLKSRKPVTGTYPQSDIPDRVVIKKLSKKYEPVDLPHRKMVNALVKRIEGNKLAEYFHNDEATVCKGCHHNSPASKKPPQCGDCHGRTADEKNPLKPGIIAAYHQQCMGCHQEMGIKKPVGCTECHAEKKINTVN